MHNKRHLSQAEYIHWHRECSRFSSFLILGGPCPRSYCTPPPHTPFPKIMDGLKNREAPWWGEISLFWEDTNTCVSWNKFDVAGLCETSIILLHYIAPRSSSPSLPLVMKSVTLELHLSGLIGTASRPDMQKIRIIGFFFENRPQWQFAVRLLLFTACTCV